VSGISEQRSFFAEHGWLVIRGGVDPRLLVDVRAVYDELMAPYRDGHAASLTGTALWQIPGAERARPPVLGLLRRSGLAELAADLLDDPQVRLLQEAFLLKCGGHGGRIEAHQDYSYTGYLDSPRTLGLRFPLAPETRESGCMWVVDGSHRWELVGGVYALSDSLRDARRAPHGGAGGAARLAPGHARDGSGRRVHPPLPDRPRQRREPQPDAPRDRRDPRRRGSLPGHRRSAALAGGRSALSDRRGRPAGRQPFPRAQVARASRRAAVWLAR